jgi:hypothetical protein
VRAQANAAVGKRLRTHHSELDLEEALLGLAMEVVDLVTATETIELNRLMIAEANRFPLLVREVTAIGLLDLHTAVARAFESMAARGILHLDGSALPVAVRFCDMMVGLAALHGALGVRWTVPDRAELRARTALFAEFHRPRRV